MIEAIIGFFADIILELAVEGLKSKKIPMPIRIIIFSFFFLLIFACTIFCLYIGVFFDVHVIIKIVSLMLALALTYLLIRLTRLMLAKEED